MDVYSQIQYHNEQMMLYQAMRMQQEACFYNSYVQAQPECYEELKPSKKGGKRSYVQCELWKRQTLIEKVEKEGLTIKDAAKELSINYSTAKHIMKVFRQTGEVETKIMMKRKTKESNDCYQESDMQTTSDVPIEPYSSMQPGYFSMGMNHWQLPIDANMVDIDFHPWAIEVEEKADIHAFLFEQHE